MTADGIISDVIDLFEANPWILFVTTILSAAVIGGFLFLIVKAIAQAGRVQPPRVVLSLLVALIGLVAILAATIRPDVDALAVAAGAAIGALSGALTAAFTENTEDVPMHETYGPELDADGDGDA